MLNLHLPILIISWMITFDTIIEDIPVTYSSRQQVPGLVGTNTPVHQVTVTQTVRCPGQLGQMPTHVAPDRNKRRISKQC